MPSGYERALVSSSWANAWALKRGCSRLGIRLRTSDPWPWFPIARAATTELTGKCALFFTDEASLSGALESPGAAHFLPRRFPRELLDDKVRFSEWLVEIGEKAVRSYREPEEVESFPCLLKSRHSWRGGRNLPKGWVCRDREELERRLREVRELGWDTRHFFFQPWLESPDGLEYSVAGFHDATAPERNLYCVTRKVDRSAHPSTIGLCLTVPDPAGLVRRTEKLLERLDYQGPFELQFITAGTEYLVLELNPRFWLQHGLFVEHGNGLLRRYLGLPVEPEREQVPEGCLWIDTFWLIKMLLGGRLEKLEQLRNEPHQTRLFWPPLTDLPQILPSLLWKRWRSKRQS